MSPTHQYNAIESPSTPPAASAPRLSRQPTKYEPYRENRGAESPSRLPSLDLTITRDTYENWTELQELPSSKKWNADTKSLLETRARRSSNASDASSSSTIVRQNRAVQCLESAGSCVSAFWKLPIIRHILWPFRFFRQLLHQILVKSRFHGWRMGILLGCLMSTTVLGANVALLVLGATREKGFQNGFAVLMSGVAEDMAWWSSAIHIAINALSTALLAASNYSMQVLSSPTRKDIDKMHAKRESMDIGVLSTRNLARIPRRRLVLFLIMGVSTIPIHLFYNSAVFYIAANNKYQYKMVDVQSAEYANLSAQIGSIYDLLHGDRWAKVYGSPLISYGDLFLVTDEYRMEIWNDTRSGRPPQYPNSSQEDLDRWNEGGSSFRLNITGARDGGNSTLVRDLTEGSSTREWVRFSGMLTSNNDEDRPRFAHVKHALGARVDTASRIQLSLVFLIVVIMCNAIKLLTMIWVLFAERKDYVVTLGDGAASFLERPDPTTERMCVLSKQEVTEKVKQGSERTDPNDALSRLTTQSTGLWSTQFRTYSDALNRDRVVGSYFMFIVIGTLFMTFMATITTGYWRSNAWGTKSETAFRVSDPTPGQTLLNAWIANAPQLVLSFCYLAINSECTAMASASEWNCLASEHKGLRVTQPQGEQRDTYFLQLPYKWSLPLTAISGGLHFLLSQSLFLVRIDTYDRRGRQVREGSRSACGFSGTSWMVFCIVFFILVTLVGLFGRRKMKTKIPFAASSSLVISAACHPSLHEEMPHLQRVRWGVVEKPMFDGRGHCSLSSGRVLRPKIGEMYL